MKQKIKLNKQYGITNKDILQNKNISIKAKGLYTYLCARAGNKGYCNPTVSTICNDLNINDATFHKYKNELINNNIIKVTKQGKGIKQSNVYQLPKVTKGYGIVYLDILKDNNINLQAKAIYGLLACYAGTRFVAYPLAKLIYSYLKISRNTYFKALKLLKVHNIVKTKQLHINGRFAYCNYYIHGVKPNKTNTKYIFKFKNKNKVKNKNNKITTTTTHNTIITTNSEYQAYTELIKVNIEYEALQGLYVGNTRASNILSNILSILVNTAYMGQIKGIKANGVNISESIVKQIYNKLNYNHIKNVVDSVVGVQKINNLREYLKVALFNSYYQYNK